MPLNGRHILLGVTGGIAAYKAADVASQLGKRRATVTAIMTAAAREFLAPLTLQTLTRRPVVTTLFDPTTPDEIEHIALARAADLFLVAPCTANVLAKLAQGIADDALTTICLATDAPLLLAPAMNTKMWVHPATQANITTLRERGAAFVEPEEGDLACGDVGPGRLAAVETILAAVETRLVGPQDFAGMHVVVTAGPTREALDPIRFITNHSSGKMGFALAEAAAARGARVSLISGPTALPDPTGVHTVCVESAADMAAAVFAVAKDAHVFIGAAAVADFTPVSSADQKIKKGESAPRLDLQPTTDILATLAHEHGGRVHVGFSMETEEVERHARDKLDRKHLDLIVANDVTQAGAGFGHDTNAVFMLDRIGHEQRVPVSSKRRVADAVLDAIVRLRTATA